MKAFKRFAAVVSGAFAVVVGSAVSAMAQTTTTDPLGGATQSTFDAVKDYQLVLIGAAVLLVIGGIAWRMFRKYTSRAGSAT
jgi:hypothetical protein